MTVTIFYRFRSFQVVELLACFLPGFLIKATATKYLYVTSMALYLPFKINDKSRQLILYTTTT